jgi:hypothetical protein
MTSLWFLSHLTHLAKCKHQPFPSLDPISHRTRKNADITSLFARSAASVKCVSGFATTGMYPSYPNEDFVFGEDATMDGRSPNRWGTDLNHAKDGIYHNNEMGWSWDQNRRHWEQQRGRHYCWHFPATSIHVWLADSGSIRTETILRNRNVEPKENGIRRRGKKVKEGELWGDLQRS